METDVTQGVTDQTTVEPVSTVETPPQAPVSPDTVTLNRDEYDRLQQAVQLADQLQPIADQIRSDPFFAQRLAQATAGPPAPAAPAPEDFGNYNNTFYDDPAKNTAEITKKVVRNEFLPEVEKTARALQLQYNRLAIENFRMNKRASDQDAAGIMPIFEQAINKTTDSELGQMDGTRLANSLAVAYDMAAGQYYRGQRAKVPKEAAPPIAGAPVGSAATAATAAKPSGAEWEYILGLARSLGKDEAYALKMWQESEQEVKAANA